MTKHPNLAVARLRVRAWMLGLLACACFALPAAGLAQSLILDNYYWYAPEHEKYAPTTFFGEPRFDSRTVRVRSAQRFKLLAGGRGWYLIQFDIAGKVYIHQRLLRNMVYDPATGDAWGEFQRASVFEEEPTKIEARMQAARTNPQAAESDSKVPSWKRYKDSWGLKTGRSTPPQTTTGETTADAASTTLPSRPQERKARNSRYPLLPPIGAEPKQENPDPQTSPPADGTNVPPPQFP